MNKESKDDIFGLEDAQKKKAKLTVTPPEDKFLTGTILTYVDKDQLAHTMRAVAGHATFQLWNLRPHDEDTSPKLADVNQCPHCQANKPPIAARVDGYRQKYC